MVNNLLWTGGVRRGYREGKKNLKINRYNRYQSIYFYRKSIPIEDWYRLLTIAIHYWLRLDYWRAIKADLAAQAIAHFIIPLRCYSILSLFLWIFIILGGSHVRHGMQVVTSLQLKLCHVTIHWYKCLFSVGWPGCPVRSVAWYDTIWDGTTDCLHSAARNW